MLNATEICPISVPLFFSFFCEFSFLVLFLLFDIIILFCIFKKLIYIVPFSHLYFNSGNCNIINTKKSNLVGTG